MSDPEKVFDVAETLNNFFINLGKSIQDIIQAPSYASKIEDVDFIFFSVGYAEIKYILDSLKKILHPPVITTLAP